MRKLIFIVSICLLTITIASGQAIRLGVLFGPNVSTIISQGSNETSSGRLSLHAGLFTEFTFGRWSVEPGLSYASIGDKTNYTDTYAAGGSASYTYSLQYLLIPVNIVYNTPGHIFFFGGGPYFGYGLSGNESGNISSNNFDSTPPYTSSFNEKYPFTSANNPDYGINVVAGVHLSGGTIFTIGYQYSLNSAIKNQVFSLSLGHKIF